MKNQETIERLYKIGMWIAGLTILAMFVSLVSLEASEIRDEMPHILYDCPEAQSTIYNYVDKGTMLLDTDTGIFHNIYRCTAINGYKVIWEWKGENNESE